MNQKKRKIPTDSYKESSRFHQIQAWALGISCFVAFFSFFWGIAYQYVFTANNSNDARKNAHAVIVDKFEPYYNMHNDNGADIIAKILTSGGYYKIGDSVSAERIIKEDVLYRMDDILRELRKCSFVSEETKYYVSRKDFDTITFNNARLNLLFTIHHGNWGKINKKDLNVYHVKNIGFCDTINNFESRIIEQFKQEQNNITNQDLSKILERDDRYMAWDVMEKALKEKVDSNRLSSYEKSLLYKARYNMLSTLTLDMARNDSIIRENLNPLNENPDITKVQLVGIRRSAICLVLLLILGFFLWWVVIKCAFSKAEIFNPLSADEQERLKQLNAELAMVNAIIELYEKK